MKADEKKMIDQMMYPEAFGIDAVIQISQFGECLTISKKDEPELFNTIIQTVKNFVKNDA